MTCRFTNVLCAALIGASVARRARARSRRTRPRHGAEFLRKSSSSGGDLTPDGWAKNADGMPKCEVSSSGTDLVEQKWKTDSLEGIVSLPKDFREAPVAPGADGNRWIGADSSSVEIHGTHALYRGGMGLGGMDIGRPLGTTACALTLEGRPAPSHKLQLTRPTHGDTLNVDTPNTVIRNAVGLQLVILTHTPAREAELLAAAQSLKVAAPRSP
jgi:hypothetical protein